MLQKEPDDRPSIMEILNWRTVKNTITLEQLNRERLLIHLRMDRLIKKEKILQEIQLQIKQLEVQ